MSLRHPHSKDAAKLVLLAITVLAGVGVAYILAIPHIPTDETAVAARQAAQAGFHDATRRLEANPNWSTDASVVAAEARPSTYPVAHAGATANVSVDRFVVTPTDADTQLVVTPPPRFRIVSTARVRGLTAIVQAEAEIISSTGRVNVISFTEDVSSQ